MFADELVTGFPSLLPSFTGADLLIGRMIHLVLWLWSYLCRNKHWSFVCMYTVSGYQASYIVVCKCNLFINALKTVRIRNVCNIRSIVVAQTLANRQFWHYVSYSLSVKMQTRRWWPTSAMVQGRTRLLNSLLVCKRHPMVYVQFCVVSWVLHCTS